MTPKIDAPWLQSSALQALLGTLNADGEEARVVGGAVRNTLLNLPVTDVDVATTTLPDETMRRAAAAGFRPIPTGIDHGTITVVTPERPFEVTTLRRDVATDGRHATVAFGRDWAVDAGRRDFTINALYCDADGTILDPAGGLADLPEQRLRFIGDAAARIEEDYLRILRFFRFFAWYGRGRPDAEGLRACARLKDGLRKLSAERVWSELRKLLGARDPSRALLWMRQAGVLTVVMPESERWGIDAIHGLVTAEQQLGWSADAMLRLEAIVPPDEARLAELARRLRLSNAERDRLLAFATAEEPVAEESDGSFRRRLYFGDRQAVIDRLRLAYAAALAKGEEAPGGLSRAAILARQLSAAERFDPPAFPLSGDDLAAAGIAAGPEMGRQLKSLRDAWVDSGFVMTPEQLLARLE